MRIGVIKARAGKAEGRETQSHREHRAGKAEGREGRRPGNTESSENTERKIAMVGACLGVDDSFKDLQWTVLDATV